MNSNIKILIVDDLASNRDFLTTLLGYQGYQLREASDGSNALAAVHADRPDLIITDVLMPAMDGLELVRQLCADPATAAIPVIVYSARVDHWKSRALARSNGIHHLSKPSDPEVILRLVEQALAAGVAPAETPAAQDDPPCHRFDRMSEAVDRLETLNYKIAALIDFIEQSLLEGDPRRLLESYSQTAQDIIEAEGVAVVMFSDDGQYVRHFCTGGLDLKTPIGPGPSSAALRHLRRLCGGTRPLLLSDLRDVPEFSEALPSQPEARALICLPVGSSSQPIGVLCLIGKAGVERFSDEDERLAALLASQLASAYENATLSQLVSQSPNESRGERTETEATQ